MPTQFRPSDINHTASNRDFEDTYDLMGAPLASKGQQL